MHSDDHWRLQPLRQNLFDHASILVKSVKLDIVKNARFDIPYCNHELMIKLLILMLNTPMGSRADAIG